MTVVFDRGGYSPQLFAELIAAGFDVLTYRKGRFPRVLRKRFAEHTGVVDGRKIAYLLADQEVQLRLPRGKRLPMRQVTRLSPDAHQTPVLTSRRDLRAIEVAYRMFERWRQENFFKYLREEFALDALVEYRIQPDDESRTVPNPARRRIEGKLRSACAFRRQASPRFANFTQRRRSALI